MGQCSAGRVYLVGGGPGDAGLLTLRGQECLARAEVVLYDYLVNPRLLEHAPQAQWICLGRHGQDRIWSQEEVDARLIELARGGQTVVRLKGGDPAVFGHLAEEIEALRQARIDYEIVPGVTAASAAACYAGIPLTARDAASAVAFVTGHEETAKGSPLSYGALAQFPGTLVFYMGVTTVRLWSAGLIAGGKPAATPAACVVRASWPNQNTFVTTLGGLADAVERRRIRPPAVMIVGEVAAQSGTIDWFSRRPLAGVRVLVTRPTRHPDSLADRLSELGAEVFSQPAIEIGAPPDDRPLEQALERLGEYQWVVFSSVHGVEAVCRRLWEMGRDGRAFGTARLAAIGPGTAAALHEFNLRADLVPSEFRAEALAAALEQQASGRRFLLIRASRGRDVLAQQLRKAGGAVEEVVAYTSRDVTEADPQIRARLAAGGIDWITVTSSAIARALVGLFGPDLARARLASLSPITSATLAELQLVAATEATVYTTAGLVDALLSWQAARQVEA